MKVKFLGTSAGWPLPRLGCQCKICTSRDPKDKRTRTQILIDDSILLDAGPDTYRHLMGMDSHLRGNDKEESIAHKLKAVLISHAHPDHILGLWDLPHIYGRKENNVNNIKMYVTLPTLNNIKSTFFSQFQPIEVKVEKANAPFNIGNVKVTYFPVIHGKTPAFGIKLKSNKIFVYITDFNRILPSQEIMVKHADCWAIDGSSLGKLGQSPSHISINDGIELAKKYRIKHTYFIHIGHKTGTHRFLEEYLHQNAGPNFHAAYDGLELEL